MQNREIPRIETDRIEQLKSPSPLLSSSPIPTESPASARTSGAKRKITLYSFPSQSKLTANPAILSDIPSTTNNSDFLLPASTNSNGSSFLQSVAPIHFKALQSSPFFNSSSNISSPTSFISPISLESDASSSKQRSNGSGIGALSFESDDDSDDFKKFTNGSSSTKKPLQSHGLSFSDSDDDELILPSTTTVATSSTSLSLEIDSLSHQYKKSLEQFKPYLADGFEFSPRRADLGEWNAGFWCTETASGKIFLVKIPKLNDNDKPDFQRIIKEYVGLKVLKQLKEITESSIIFPEVSLHKSKNGQIALYIEEVENFKDYIKVFKTDKDFIIPSDLLAEIAFYRSIISDDDWGPNNTGQLSNSPTTVSIDLDRAFHYEFVSTLDIEQKLRDIFEQTYLKKGNIGFVSDLIPSFAKLEGISAKLISSIEKIFLNVTQIFSEISSLLTPNQINESLFDIEKRNFFGVVNSSSYSPLPPCTPDSETSAANSFASTQSLQFAFDEHTLQDSRSRSDSDMSICTPSSEASDNNTAITPGLTGLTDISYNTTSQGGKYEVTRTNYANVSNIKDKFLSLIRQNLSLFHDYIKEKKIQISLVGNQFPEEQSSYSSPKRQKASHNIPGTTNSTEMNSLLQTVSPMLGSPINLQDSGICLSPRAKPKSNLLSTGNIEAGQSPTLEIAVKSSQQPFLLQPHFGQAYKERTPSMSISYS